MSPVYPIFIITGIALGIMGFLLRVIFWDEDQEWLWHAMILILVAEVLLLVLGFYTWR